MLRPQSDVWLPSCAAASVPQAQLVTQRAGQPRRPSVEPGPRPPVAGQFAMSSSNARLFLLCVAIWGTTWLAIRFQLGAVVPEVSVAYRFLLAGLLAAAIVALRRQSLRLPLAAHGLLVVFGLSTFTFGYTLVYYAETRITSGLVAVLYSLTPLLNYSAARLALAAPRNRRAELGGTLGALGVSLVFAPELVQTTFGGDLIVGVSWAFAAVLFSTVGTVLAALLE